MNSARGSCARSCWSRSIKTSRGRRKRCSSRTSGLSLLIREFENQLGFRLFDRTTRHVALTTHGSQLLAAARRSLEDLDDAMSRIGQTVRHASDTLSIGAGQLVAANILPQAIKQFRSERPGLRIELFDADPATILQKVRAGSLDWASAPSRTRRGSGARCSSAFL